MTRVRIRLLWYPQPQFAGYLLAQHRGIAAAHGIELECVPIDFAAGPIDAVLSGDCDLAVASPAHLLESRAPDGLAMILAVQQKSSLVYGARRDAGVTSFADLRAKRTAVWPGGEDLELRWALQRSGVDVAGVTLVPVNDTVAALTNADVAAAQLTTYHELFELEHHAHTLEPYVLLRAADAGAALLKDGLIARRAWLAEHAGVAQAVVDSVLAGWTAAFAGPSDAVDLCAELRPDLTRDHHARQLAEIRALACTGATLSEGLGFPDPRHVRDAVTAVHDVEGRTPLADPATAIDRRFWDAAPAASRGTRW